MRKEKIVGGKYIVTRKIGEGSFGKVYTGTNKTLFLGRIQGTTQEVAIKFVFSFKNCTRKILVLKMDNLKMSSMFIPF